MQARNGVLVAHQRYVHFREHRFHVTPNVGAVVRRERVVWRRGRVADELLITIVIVIEPDRELGPTTRRVEQLTVHLDACASSVVLTIDVLPAANSRDSSWIGEAARPEWVECCLWIAVCEREIQQSCVESCLQRVLVVVTVE